MARRNDVDPNQLTEEEFGRWEPVRDVVAFVKAKHPFLYEDTIKARVRSGALRVAAKRIAELDDRGDVDRERRRVVIIPGWIDSPDPRFWDIGDHTVRVRRELTGLTVSAEIEGVRFHPDDVDELRRDLGLKPTYLTDAEKHRNLAGWNQIFETMANAVEASQRARPNKPSVGEPRPQKRRGPKPKPYWKLAIAAVEADISSGKLRPENLADVERAIAAWLSGQEHYPGESTIRIYAKKVWDPIDPQGQ